MIKKLTLILILGLFLASCGDKPRRVEIVRLDQALESYRRLSDADKANMQDSLRGPIEAFFKVFSFSNPQKEHLMWWSCSDEVRMFQPDVDSVFPNLDSVEEDLGYIVQNAKRDSIDVDLDFVSVVWGKPQPILVVDSVALIALNHFLGEDYAGYSHWDAYRRAEKTPQQLKYQLAAVIAANQYPFTTKEAPTVLNWLLYEGALTEAKMRLVDGATLNQALAYRPDQLEDVQDNLSEIKKEMAARKMLYSTDPDLINRLFAAAPSSPFLDGQLPGRAARLVGYDLVCQYMRKHPDAKLSFLLSPEFYDNPNTLLETGF